MGHKSVNNCDGPCCHLN